MKKFFLIIIIFLANLTFCFAKETVTFDSCVDGDTIKVNISGKKYTVRLLAIDTPESVHPTKEVEYYGKEASEYTCQKVTNAKKITLEYDNNSDKQDKYDRLLAWVFVDDILLQEELVELGYAKVAYLYGDYKYTDILYQKQEIASINKIGIWDTTAEEEYKKTNTTTKNEQENIDYTQEDIIIIVILLMIIVFVGNKSIKKKATKKLKKYLK